MDSRLSTEGKSRIYLAKAAALEEETVNFNIIVAGFEGQGKSTFINQMFFPFTNSTSVIDALRHHKTKDYHHFMEKIEQNKAEIRANARKLIEAQTLYSKLEPGTQEQEAARENMHRLAKESKDLEQTDKSLTSLANEAERKSEEAAKSLQALLKEIEKKKKKKAEVLGNYNRDYAASGEELKEIDDWLMRKERESKYLRNKIRENTAGPGMKGEDMGEKGHRTPTQTIEEKYIFTVRTDNKTVRFSVTDTPGYGNTMDIDASVNPIVEHAKQRFIEHEAARRKGGAEFLKMEREDSLFHCCFYFIKPHEMSDIDIEFMSRLSGFVPIIPIMAKADSMIEEEQNEYKKRIREKTNAAGLKLYEFDPKLINLSKETGYLKGYSQLLEHYDVRSPHAVVATQKDETASGDGAQVGGDTFTRRYPWGVVDCEKLEHSALPFLREMVVRLSVYHMRNYTKATLFTPWSTENGMRPLEHHALTSNSNLRCALDCRCTDQKTADVRANARVGGAIAGFHERKKCEPSTRSQVSLPRFTLYITCQLQSCML